MRPGPCRASLRASVERAFRPADGERGGRLDGQVHEDDGSDAFLRADAQSAAVELGEGTGDREAEARALVAAVELHLDLLERLPELADRFLGNADAAVLDIDVDRPGR